MAFRIKDAAAALVTSAPDDHWSQTAKEQWTLIQRDPTARGVLDLFAEYFILLGRLPSTSQGTLLYKIAYLSLADIRLRWRERLALAPIRWGLSIEGGTSSSRSYHLRFVGPPDLEVADVRAPAGASVRGYKKTAHHRAHLYVTDWTSRPRVAELSLSPIASGFLRVAMLATLLTAGVHAVALLLLDHVAIIIEQGQGDVAVALLLVVPTVISAYVARPGPHRLANRPLTVPRLVLGGPSLLPYLTAGILLFVRDPSLRRLLVFLTCAASVCVASYCMLIWDRARR